MEAAKGIAARFLTRLGFNVQEIPVNSDRTADLRVSDDADVYLIEVKEKYESEENAKARSNGLQNGDLYHEEMKLWSDNRISAILRDAQQQLDRTPRDRPDTFQIIWFHAYGLDAEVKAMQAMATFYGDVPVSPRWPHKGMTKHCFYFDYSAAFEMPTVDALFVSERDKLTVCMNECATRANQFRKTKLYSILNESKAVVDPLTLASAGEVIFCRSTISRKDEDAVAKALEEQTGVSYAPIRLKRYIVSVAVRPETGDKGEDV